jgi:uncharacterized protein (TIGR00297 family)
MGPIPLSDTLLIIVFSIATGVSAFYLEKLTIIKPEKKVTARKYLHIIACGLSTIAAALITNLLFLALIVALCLIPVTYLVLKKNFFSIGDKKSYGIIYFPLIFLILLLIFADRPDRWLIVGPMGFLTLSDAFATLVGLKYSQRFFNFTGEKKSVIGSTAFIIVSFVWMLVIRQIGFQADEPIGEYLVFSLFISLVAAGFEIMGSGGRDNLYVPSGTAFMFWAYSLAPVRLDPYYMLSIAIILIAAAVLAWKLKLLDGGGAFAALLMGTVILCFGHFSIWPLVVFFVSGALLGKLPGRRASDIKDGKPRDYTQVLSNGGVALALAYINCIVNSPILQLLYLISVAVSAADTWSSEIGQRLSRKTLDLKTFKILPAGLSGCVSLPGTIAAIAGAASIALFSGSLPDGIIITIFGFAGSLIDSVIGAFFQGRYADIAKPGLSDYGHGKPISGFSWMTNDLVNLVSNIIISSIASIYLFLK